MERSDNSKKRKAVHRLMPVKKERKLVEKYVSIGLIQCPGCKNIDTIEEGSRGGCWLNVKNALGGLTYRCCGMDASDSTTDGLLYRKETTDASEEEDDEATQPSDTDEEDLVLISDDSDQEATQNEDEEGDDDDDTVLVPETPGYS